MVEIAVVLLGVILLMLPFGAERWPVGSVAFLLGIAALAATGVIAWISLPAESQAIAEAATALFDNVRIAPEVAILTLLGIGALAGVALSLRRERD
jgi:hypothetical protein